MQEAPDAETLKTLSSAAKDQIAVAAAALTSEADMLPAEVEVIGTPESEEKVKNTLTKLLEMGKTNPRKAIRED